MPIQRNADTGEPVTVPSASAINAYIDRISMQNGRQSPLTGKGQYILDLGKKYHIQPAVIVGIMMKENSLGTVDDAIANPTFNNFGGNTCGAVGVTVSTGCGNAVGRSWDIFPTVDAGIEGVYQTINAGLYRGTDGTLGAITNIYSPASDGNNPDDMFAIYGSVGSALGVPLTQSTKVYTDNKFRETQGGITGAVGSAIGGAIDSAQSAYDLVTKLPGFIQNMVTQGLPRLFLVLVGLVILFLAVKGLV